jgi:pectate lyase
VLANMKTCPAFAASPAEQLLSAAPAQCSDPSASNWPGLTLKNGDVVGAAILDEIDGYAQSAGTTGGLGGELVEVTTTADYDSDAGEAPVQGSLRMIVEQADRANTPIWVTFSPALGRGATITLKRPLHLGNDVTIDGTCSDITIQGLSRIGLFYLIDRHNIIVDRLRFRKTNYVSGLPNAELGTAIRLGGAFDAIAILHNDLSECGDGCIDTTSGRGKQVPALSRVTIAFNYIHDHDKTMLFGTLNCADGDDCTTQEAAQNAALGPGLFMTMEGNALIRDAQRNPKVFGRVMLHCFNNYIAFQPHQRPQARPSASYGILVLNGGRALIEHNCFVPLNPGNQAVIFTAGTPGTRRAKGDWPGFIRLAGGPQAPVGAIVVQNDPANVSNPPYAYHPIALESLPPPQALACIASRAGRGGAASWDNPACKIAGS